jgi:YfiH family protein
VNRVPVLRMQEFENVGSGLVAGITTRAGLDAKSGGRGGVSDFGLATGGDFWSVSNRYGRLATGLGFSSVAVCRQVHGNCVASAEGAPGSGLWVPEDADGMIGAPSGCLLVVTVADCVPVYLFEPATESIGLLHAGWRGSASGVLRRGIDLITAGVESRVSGLRIHCGPSICGDCYEVGPEVKQAMGQDESENSGLDLRAFLRQEALDAGVSATNMTVSSLCTQCDPDRFHSHRAAGDTAGRMAAFLGRAV